MRILSRAYSKSLIVTDFLSCRVAQRAASLTRLRMSAPVRPTVPRASRLKSTSSLMGTPWEWSSKSSRRPAMVGRSTVMWRSNRPGRKQGGIEDVGPIGGGDDDDGGCGAEAIHLAEDLVERLLAFVVAAAEAGTALAADGVDLVDEQDGGGGRLGRFEHVADAARADADKELNELGAVDREEGNLRFAGDGLGEQRFARAGRAHQEHAFGDAGAEALELFGLLEELDDFLEVLLDVAESGDVVEGDAGALFGIAPGGAAEDAGEHAAAEHLVARLAGHVPTAEDQETQEDEPNEREEVRVSRSARWR